MRFKGIAACSLAAGVIAAAACSDPLTAPKTVGAPSFAIIPAEAGLAIVCLADGGTNASFSASKAGRVGDATTGPAVPANFDLTPNNCLTIWTRPSTGDEPVDDAPVDYPVVFTVSLTSGNSAAPVSVIDFADNGDACDGVAPSPASAQGAGTTTTVGCANAFHGVRFTFFTEPPDEPGGEGCTPGYWKQQHHYDSWEGYDPSDDFDTVFGVNFFSPDKTLGEAVALGGGGLNALARMGVAALLNAASGDVDFAYTEAEVIDAVQGDGDFAGLTVEQRKDLLDAANNGGCPLN